MRFYVHARANLIDKEVCEHMKAMNVTTVQFGLESGSERVLKYLKKGNVTVEQNRSALAMCKKFGFRTVGSFIIGSPGETEEDLKQTLSLVRDGNLDQARVFQLTPFPKTELWEYAKQKGLVSDSPDFNLKKIFAETFREDMNFTDEISPQKLKEWYELFQKEVEKKIKKTSALSYAKHMKYLFTKRFLEKAFQRKNKSDKKMRKQVICEVNTKAWKYHNGCPKRWACREINSEKCNNTYDEMKE